MQVKSKKHTWAGKKLSLILALTVILSLCVSACKEETPVETAVPGQTQALETKAVAPGSVIAETEVVSTEEGSAEPKDQDDLDIEAAMTKAAYTQEGVAAEDPRLDQIVANCAGASINSRDAQIYYAMQFLGFMDNYGDIALYFGLDATQPLAEQKSTVGNLTWEQYFLMWAMDEFQTNAAFAAKAKAEGHSLTEAEQRQLSEVREGLQERYSSYGFDSVNAYIQSNFGVTADYEAYVRYLELYFTAMSYQNKLYQDIALTDAQRESYFDEHPEEFEGIDKDQYSVNVRHILVAVDSEAGESEEVLSGKKEDAKKKAEAILADFLTDPSEEHFAALAYEHTEDPGSQDNGGLYAEVLPGQMMEPFNDWCFDEVRRSGDTGIVETDYGYHVMYFVSAADTPFWIVQADEGIRYEQMLDHQEALLAEYPKTVNYENVILSPLPQQG